MTQPALLWISNNPDWEDVRSTADKAYYSADAVRISYGGATEDEGHYEGEFEIALREGMQTIEGEYTVFPPKGTSEPFTQVVSFVLVGQIKPHAAGGHAFSGVWEEGGIAQAFELAPIWLDGVPPQADADVRSPAIEATTGQPWRAGLAEYRRGVAPYRELVNGVGLLADFDRWLLELDQVVAEVEGRLAEVEAGQLAPSALAEWLRDEASLRLEAVLDAGASLPMPAGVPAALAQDLAALAERLQFGVLREGYSLCKQWLGLAEN